MARIPYTLGSTQRVHFALTEQTCVLRETDLYASYIKLNGGSQ